MMLFGRLILAGLVATVAAQQDASAQAFPSKSIRLVVPFAPGGGSDLVARSLNEPLGRQLGQPVLVVNRDGAGTIVGMNEVAHSPPDGYTMIFNGNSLTINTASGRKLPYDLAKDLQPLSLVSVAGWAMVVRRTSSFNSVPDLVKYARESGNMKFASAGVGSGSHLVAELFNQAAGIKGTHVAYRGAAPAMQDLAGGQVDYLLTATAAAITANKSGQFRTITVTTRERSPQLPDVPTATEQGAKIDSSTWFGILLPSGTPAAVMNRLQPALKVALADPGFVERLRSLGSEPKFTTPQEFGAHIKSEVDSYTRLIKDLNITFED